MNDAGFDDFPPDDAANLASLEALGEEISQQGRQYLSSEVVALFPGIEASQRDEHQIPPLIRAPALLARPLKPRPWLVRDIIPSKQVCELRGDGGTGKSTLALQLCAAATTGRAWLDMPVACGPAIYLASEDDEDELHRRLDAIATYLQVQPEDMADLHLWPLASEDPALVGRDPEDGVFGQTSRWDQLESFVRKIHPVVVVLDSRADVFGGEEINRGQVRAFVALLRKLAVDTGAAVIILAHPSNTGLANRTGNSGSTHWTNSVRAAINFTKVDGEGADPDLRKLEVVKNNYARPAAPTTLRWSAGALVVANNGAPANRSRQEEEARVDRLFLDLLARYLSNGRRLSEMPASNYAPKLFAMEPDANGVRKFGFEEAMRRLFKAGVLKMETSGPPTRQLRKMVIVSRPAP